jgi:diadenosine tetraphosphatase ApaH/serine/threonine PP2A family protein phosphatase
MGSKVYAILGDIHANIDALNAVLVDARSCGVTDFVSVGDVVAYNASPRECIKVIRDELGCPVVRGNHDHYISHDVSLNDFSPNAAIGVKWTREQLSEKDIKWLHDLPLSRPVMGFTLVHSTLDMPEQWGYVFDAEQAKANFSFQRTPVCFHGHTHVPIVYAQTATGMFVCDPEDFKISLGIKFFINVGSVGQPRDGDPRASYVIYDTTSRNVYFRRVPYDVEAAQERIRRAGLPEALALRLGRGS